MISARRLAREWALKILYQVDVGKTSIDEARDTSIDRLRLEFVHRGSRTASGSRAEEIVLDYVTSRLEPFLGEIGQDFEKALTLATGRLTDEMPYWQDVRFERALRTLWKGVRLSPPHLLEPLPDAHFLTPPRQGDALGDLIVRLSPPDLESLRRYVEESRQQIPALLDSEVKRVARADARSVFAARPETSEATVLAEYLHARRSEVVSRATRYWHSVGAMAQKQTGGWLRTAGFCRVLVQGAYAHRDYIDAAIANLAEGWRLERLVAVDRSILRLAGSEIVYLPSVPSTVSINEAVELAKKYSTAESGRFVNGVLGALADRAGGEKHAPGVDDGDTAVDVSDLEDLREDEPGELGAPTAAR